MEILDTTSKEEKIKIFSFKKLATAFLIGFGIDFTRRLIEPAQGPFDILIAPIFAIYYTAKFFLLVVIAGLIFYIPQLKDIWFKNKLPFMIVLFIGIVLFCYGTITANHIYFDLHKSSEETDNYLDNFALPGFILMLFSLSFRPFRPFRFLRHKLYATTYH